MTKGSHYSGKTWQLEYRDYSKEVGPGEATGDYSLKFSYLVVEH